MLAGGGGAAQSRERAVNGTHFIVAAAAVAAASRARTHSTHSRSRAQIKAVASSPSGVVFTASRDRSVRAWKLGADDVALQTHAHTAHQAR